MNDFCGIVNGKIIGINLLNDSMNMFIDFVQKQAVQK